MGAFLRYELAKCESNFAEGREGLTFGAGNYAQAGRKLANWLNMFNGHRPRAKDS